MQNCSKNNLSTLESKDFVNICKIIKEKKQNGKKIVMTCGCFSILHPGHIELLKIAKKQGDVLVVGINCDNYIKENKKYTLFFNQDERLEMILELQCVDYGFIFYENDFCVALEKILPDVFVKGPDYENKIDIKEKQICCDKKIDIEYAGQQKKYSSSRILNKG